MEIPLLTSGESKVYVTLTELGESTVGDILKISGVSHSKIYDILKRLSNKGLVSSINKNGRQYFSASNPKALLELLDSEKSKIEDYQARLEDIIKKLDLKKNTAKSLSTLSSYEGFKGMKYALELILNRLKKNDGIYILGSPKQIGESMGGYLKEWQQRRIKIGAVCKIITDIDSPPWKDKWWKESKSKKLTFTKRSDMISPAYIIITKNSITTIYFSHKIFSFLIEQEDVSKSYINFFNQLWKTSKNK
jgi:sugar-specific transcriptional regulator TrmB